MVVNEVVATALRQLNIFQAGLFVASCAERMAQVFTGLQARNLSRAQDIDFVIRLLDDLWVLGGHKETFQAYNASISMFLELDSTDEEEVELGGVEETYSFYAVLVLHYASLFRSSGDVEVALNCAHVCLTAMGQFDQNLPESALFVEENERQQRVVSLLMAPGIGADLALQLRAQDQVIGRERFAIVKSRLTDRPFSM